MTAWRYPAVDQVAGGENPSTSVWVPCVAGQDIAAGVEVNFGAETLCLCAHRAGEVGCAPGLRKAGVIVHLGRGRQGTAGQMALDDHDIESGGSC